jgi:TonB family protein
VRLRVEITPEGRAQNFIVQKSLDPGLDANAIASVWNWRFKPAMKDGEPVAVIATIEVTFHLE